MLQWARNLVEPDHRTAWLGVPLDAEVQRLQGRAEGMLRHARLLIEASAPTRSVTGADGSRAAEQQHRQQVSASKPQLGWLAVLKSSAEAILSELPTPAPPPDHRVEGRSTASGGRTTASSFDPIDCCLRREREMCAALISLARTELASSSLWPTRADRIAASLPELVQAAMGGASRASSWATGLKARWQQLERLQREPHGAVWLGGLREPQAFLSATKQKAARAGGCRLEEMELRLEIATEVAEGSETETREGSADDAVVAILGLAVQGVGVRGNNLVPVDGTSELQHVRLVWARPRERPPGAAQARLLLPLYDDGTRRVQLAEAELTLVAATAAPAPSRPATDRANQGNEGIAEDVGLHRGAAVFATFDP